ncbi:MULTISPECIES: hypothetical protein [unclassified Azospirillum]|uniref:hypothetical protein n=1 Tax=unclassified Azospirillum TaxID=2630922 RepID=UPI000B72F1F9|nr:MULTISPECIES: hypothetical protein [unclassified Azospirillum]SNT10040.1 hypothetical protein SAMN05880556_12344 [Azospirillum sp. RU38E]SNT25522.1 hypothetical protein SAMN05880591_12444 [Azospirillum sp. RU37A]
MTMLEGAEFFSGSLDDVNGLCLVMPRDQHEEFILAVPGNPRTAIYLDGETKFQGFTYTSNDDWQGLIIPGVRIEVDVTSTFNADSGRAPLGAVIRRVDYLAVAVLLKQSGVFGRQINVPVASGLQPCAQGCAVGFRKWQIVLGEGQAKRVLRKIDIDAVNS